ncbi:hypothetical protein EON70_00750 [bacterium]|nr:MAG: hypothetical protein EON70_00750 [bacterium]
MLFLTFSDFKPCKSPFCLVFLTQSKGGSLSFSRVFSVFCAAKNREQKTEKHKKNFLLGPVKKSSHEKHPHNKQGGGGCSVQASAFYSSALKAAQRIGPHRQDVIEGLVGNLLGDGFAEKRGGSTRILLKQSAEKVQYITFLHQFLCKAGICNANIPRLSKVVGKSGKQYFSTKFATYSFSSLNFIHEAFYVKDSEKRFVKRVPPSIGDMLTERGLAHWIMDDGSPYKSGRKTGGLRLSTDSFSFQDVSTLQKALLDNFSLESTLHRHKMQPGNYKPIISISKDQRPRLKKLCGKYFVDAMMYKLES